jgi:hypothetical protein
MGRIKSLIVKILVLTFNAALVVGGVFFIKNQADKNKENQAAVDATASDQETNEQLPTEDTPETIVEQPQLPNNVPENVPAQTSTTDQNIPNSNTPTATSTVKNYTQPPATTTVPKPKKTTKTS